MYFKVQDPGYKGYSKGYGFEGFGVLASGFWIQGARSRVRDFGLKVRGLRFGNSDSGLHSAFRI